MELTASKYSESLSKHIELWNQCNSNLVSSATLFSNRCVQYRTASTQQEPSGETESFLLEQRFALKVKLNGHIECMTELLDVLVRTVESDRLARSLVSDRCVSLHSS